ncbi:MAG TPA: esterase-like activity of phytase family protein [Candidatus Polarisedimenticolaceae bacterium]
MTVRTGALLLFAALPAVTSVDAQQAELVARSTLPAATYRAGSPPCGAFFSKADRETAKGNGVGVLDAQPVQGFSSMIPASGATWWALADNGFAWRANSADFQLVFFRVDPRFGDPAGPSVLESVLLRDPDRRVPWAILCDPDGAAALPEKPLACGEDPAVRILTGFDFDPESFVRAPDGTFWVSEEFGPFLLHLAADGRLLDPPVPFPGVRSPQNPLLKAGERPNLAESRGPEGLAIDPGGTKLYALLEGAVAGDDPRDLRIYVFDLNRRVFDPAFLKVRLEMPGRTPDAPGPVSIGELKAVNEHQFLMIERDNHGDDRTAPRFKKVFLLDTSMAARDGRVGKTLLLDLLAIPDPSGVGGDGDFFRLPFYTIESVHVVDARTLLIASDNNFPFSNGRSRSRSADRTGPLAADGTEMILVRLGTPLAVDRRMLPPGRP